jgi:beta-lactamase class A
MRPTVGGMVRRSGMAIVVAGFALLVAASPIQVDARTAPSSHPGRSGSTVTITSAALRHLATAAALTVSRNSLFLLSGIESLAAASGGSVGVSVVELGGAAPITWSYNGSGVFTAASTYKLAALMMEAQEIASGAADPNGVVCYQDSDYEAGWYDDYADGACYTRSELAYRAGHVSDNTAGHMLVRDLGGADALNAWAASYGAVNSVFFTDNTTTADDLAALWSAEAAGKLGGSAAQAWLYPLLTDTATEAGIPAGVGSATVVHKTGTIDAVDNDAALVMSGPNGNYVLTVMTDGIGGDAGWQLIAAISSDVWAFESARAVR